ncbi:amidohydrolase family protein [Jannaschia ovalis]|uniref:Amidohydrolase family protein n=1 Tax=Jannaschia ovalis TaxID=3038773 RepID=A0ABY8LFA5_9RHOB|nr:amidohydrolase family protein [Jannaschia sp. GRR-S6-38]WGH78868.1 amidohydrolase family protein [Jannaschia sp. GRR-S6-38]
MALPRSAPPPDPIAPDRPAPAGTCDTHIHLLGAAGEAELWDKRAEDPADGWDFDAYLDAYRVQMAALGIERTVIVQSILFGTDNSLVARGIEALGRETTRGIGLVDDAASDADLDDLVAQGIEGVRLNYVHGGVLSWEGVEAMAPRLADRGLHVQMLLRADRHMADLAPRIRALPVPMVLDHIGWPDLAAGIDEPGFRALRDTLDHGNLWVKLSALYRHCPAPFDAADAHVAALLEANPLRCLWGSDWPHIMLGDARAAPAAVALDALDRVCPDDDTREAVLVRNPARLFGF